MTTDSLPRRRTKVPTELIAATLNAFEVCKQYIFLNIQFNFKLNIKTEISNSFCATFARKKIQLLQFFGIIFTKFHIVYAFSRKIYFSEKMQNVYELRKKIFAKWHIFSRNFSFAGNPTLNRDELLNWCNCHVASTSNVKNQII